MDEEIFADWHPEGSLILRGWPEIGMLVGLEYHAWRVIDSYPVPRGQWTNHELHEWQQTSEIPMIAHLETITSAADEGAGPREAVVRGHRARWHVFPDEHFPVCARCGEPLPCREKVDAELARAEMRRVERYLHPGMCPGCITPVASGTGVRFDRNAIIPAGPPVTFHAPGLYGPCTVEYQRYLQLSYQTGHPGNPS